MKYLIIIVVLALVLVGGGVFCGIRLITMAERINELELDYTTLQTNFNNLQQGYNQLETAHNSLQADYDSLESDYGSLKSDYDSLELDYGLLKGEFKSLQSDYRGLEYALREAEANKFMFYYTPLMDQQYGVLQLDEVMSRWEWKEDVYKASLFDCSEMSAALEHILENEGFHTVIVAGDSPSGDGYHAWLLVETSEDKYMPVEATAWSVVYWSYPYFDNYFDYDYKFEDIHEAIAYSPTEFDWWEEF